VHYKDAVENEIDDCVAIFIIAEKRAVESRRHREIAEKLRGLPPHRFDVHRQRRAGNEETVEIGIAFQLAKRLALFGREVGELLEIDKRAGPEPHFVQRNHHVSFESGGEAPCPTTTSS